MPGETAEDAIDAAVRMASASRASRPPSRVSGSSTTDLAQAAEATGDYLRLLDRIEELSLDAEISVKLTQLGIDQDRTASPPHTSSGSWTGPRSSAAPAGSTWKTSALRRPHASTSTSPSCVGSPNVGICLQAYLRRTYDDIMRLQPSGTDRAPGERRLPGAEAPRLHVEASDRRELRAAGRAPGHRRRERVALGSHDTDLIARITDELGGNDRFEVAMLYGIRTDEQRRLATEGYVVRTLISYGPSWYPWFMRRIAEKPVENTLLALRNLITTDAPSRSRS